MPIKKEDSTKVEFNDIRKAVKTELDKRFGGIYQFLNSESGKKFGGLKNKVYFYECGPVNFELTRDVCEFLGLGELSRKLIVTRTYTYNLCKNGTEEL